MTILKTIEEVEREYNISFQDILRETPINSDDIVLVSGSLIDKFGNSLSDFDVYVIGDRPHYLRETAPSKHHLLYSSDTRITTASEDGQLYQVFDYIDGSQFAIDLEYFLRDDIDRYLNEILLQYEDSFRHTSDVPGFGYKISGMLHRLFHAIPLRNSSKFNDIRSSLKLHEFCYINYRASAGGYPAIRDIRGVWLANDFLSSAIWARNFLTRQVFAFTFLNLVTNPNVKWIFKKLDNLPTRYLSLRDEYIKIMTSPLETTEECRRITLECLDLVDEIFKASHEITNTEPKFLSCADGLLLVEQEEKVRSFEHPEIKRQYLFRRKLFTADVPSCRDFVTSDCG